MEGRPPPPTPDEYAEFFEYLDRTFPQAGESPKPPSEPPAELTSEELQQRCNELFADTPSRPPPEPREPPPKLTPEELQQQLDEAFAGVLTNGGTPRTPPGPEPEPPPKLTPEELQQELNEAFAPWEWMKANPPPGPSRRLRSFRASKPATGPSRRQRCAGSARMA